MEYFLQNFPQQLVNGLETGSLYALIALGYTLIYGILEMLNFAHGDVFMVGGFLAAGATAVLVHGGVSVIPGIFLVLLDDGVRHGRDRSAGCGDRARRLPAAS